MSIPTKPFKPQNLILLLLAIFTVFSCNSKKEDGPKKIAVVISTLNNSWFVAFAESAAERARELGYEATIFDSQNNTSKEAEHFENLIAAGYSAVLFNPTDSEGSVSNVKRAKKAGVPVFCMDREVNSLDAATSQIISDSFSGCVELGEYFVRKLNKKGKYVELLGLVGDNNTWNRSKGFHSVVDLFPELEMVAQQSADFDRSIAMDKLESIMQSNPDINAVFCGNDSMAMGAYQALVAAGKEKEVMIFGFDGENDVMNAIADNKITATVMQSSKKMARTAAELADEYINGKRDFSAKTPLAVEVVTQENINKFIANN
ncbi:D-ribose ABC transporter substrate-binding protein [Mariniflexile litorale]|uniref:D-ribose ABC transporter substrate-binding protein n=1 Tax=Mariniflexile litorale TaxID=3045158 RepID=A0AAU7EGW3_9FLAO|nr:D-ribose ABC transporter substrate-binding protein [Mariniflexile sp. KMM 9835]MDQ8211719.1 D-ribose ABC transporter substrate-binding protein [Mariniflexile sp. KMM 9835]